MLALLAALLLTSPAPRLEAPRCIWWSRAEHRCRDEDVEVIGSWDPRPGPGDWPTHYYPEPREWGVYPCEQPRIAVERLP